MLPDEKGYFGDYGGQFVPETLMPVLDELVTAYQEAKADKAFWSEFEALSCDYSGRPTPLYLAEKLTEHCGGARIFLKREDLAHTGAHKINNTLGQVLLAKHMGKTRIIAETGAGQHGVATAAAAAALGLKCEVYMGEADMQRQSLNVFRIIILGESSMVLFSLNSAKILSFLICKTSRMVSTTSVSSSLFSLVILFSVIVQEVKINLSIIQSKTCYSCNH